MRSDGFHRADGRLSGRLVCWIALAFGCVGCAGAALDTTLDTDGTRPQAVLAATLLAELEPSDAPPQSDAPPRWSLAFEAAGTRARTEVARGVLAYAAFRDGVAFVDAERTLQLVAPDGARRTLSRQATPILSVADDGALWYVARYPQSDAQVELHRLDLLGHDRIAASGFANIGLIAPVDDAGALFVAARRGGIAGVHRVQGPALAVTGRVQCLSNCGLRTGARLDGRFDPLPGTAQQLLADYAEAPPLELVSDPSSDAVGGAR